MMKRPLILGGDKTGAAGTNMCYIESTKSLAPHQETKDGGDSGGKSELVNIQITLDEDGIADEAPNRASGNSTPSHSDRVSPPKKALIRVRDNLAKKFTGPSLFEPKDSPHAPRPSLPQLVDEIAHLKDDVRALKWLARRKEKEWERVLRLLKQKEERLIKAERSRMLSEEEAKEVGQNLAKQLAATVSSAPPAAPVPTRQNNVTLVPLAQANGASIPITPAGSSSSNMTSCIIVPAGQQQIQVNPQAFMQLVPQPLQPQQLVQVTPQQPQQTQQLVQVTPQQPQQPQQLVQVTPQQPKQTQQLVQVTPQQPQQPQQFIQITPQQHQQIIKVTPLQSQHRIQVSAATAGSRPDMMPVLSKGTPLNVVGLERSNGGGKGVANLPNSLGTLAVSNGSALSSTVAATAAVTTVTSSTGTGVRSSINTLPSTGTSESLRGGGSGSTAAATTTATTSTEAANTEEETSEPSSQPMCQFCQLKVSRFVCAACSDKWYCSKKCQAADWDGDHHDECV